MGLSVGQALQPVFLLYTVVGLASFLVYRRAPRDQANVNTSPAQPLQKSRRTLVLTLATLFSLDAFAGGLIVQSLLALWLHHRFRIISCGDRSDLLLVRSFFGRLLSGRGPPLQPNWAREHDGLHAPAFKRLSTADPLCSGPCDDDRPTSDTKRPVADGRSYTHLLRHGNRHPRRTGGGGKRHGRSTEPGGSVRVPFLQAG